jgi:hypothetical protein
MFGRHYRPKPRNAAERLSGRDNIAVHGGVMQGNHGAPFGLVAVSHYAAGVGALELGRCGVQ